MTKLIGGAIFILLVIAMTIENIIYLRYRFRRIFFQNIWEIDSYEAVSLLQIILAFAMIVLGLYLFIPTYTVEYNIVLGVDEADF